MSWWVTDAWNESPVFLISWIFWVIFSIVCHELAHGMAAIRCGDRTPIETGHMTWNPLVHMGQWSLIMFALFGFCWGAMPVSPHRFRRRHDDAFVAFAGPLMNLAQFTLLIALSIAWRVLAKEVAQPLQGNMKMFLFTGAMINLMGFCFNLVPVPPLDGSRIISSFSAWYRNLLRTEVGGVAALIGTALLFSAGGSKIWSFVLHTTAAAISFGVSLFGGGSSSAF